MSRLKGFSYNEELWDIKRNSSSLTIKDKMNDLSYEIQGEIIAIEEISGDTFLILKKVLNSNDILFVKFIVCNGVIFTAFSKYIKSLDFLSEDLIIFNKNYLDSKVYSISRNVEYFKDIQYIVTQSAILAETSFCLSYNVTLVYDNSFSEYPTKLLVDYKLISFHCEEYIQVLVDIESWTPISPAYSSLRNKYVEFSKEKPLSKIIKEDNYNLAIIDDFLEDTYFKDKKKSVTDFLSVIKN